MKNHPGYELVSAVGRGRLATVYRARDRSLKREVAVKELTDEARRDQRQLDRFWDEARFLAKLEHDNVVQIYGLDQERGWIIMELMAGSLDAVVASRPLAPDVVRGILHQVLDGLDCLHQKKRVHGAIKPGNLLLTSQGFVKLSDSSGIADGQVAISSAKYAAPEQFDPSFGPIGPGIDLYCLGITALELLTGPDFADLFPGVGSDGSNAEAAWRKVHATKGQPLPSAGAVAPGLPADLVAVIDRMLQKDVARRYACAADALKDLADKPPLPVPATAAPVTLAPGPILQPLKVPPKRGAPTPTAEPPHNRQDTLEPTIFPVLQPPTGASRPGASIFASAPAQSVLPAMETVRDTPRYPRWSGRWFNQKLENPWVLYPICGAIAFVTVLLLAKLLIPSGPTLVKPREVSIVSEPIGASATIDGEKHEGATPLKVQLKPGPHRLVVELADYEAQERDVEVPTGGAVPEYRFELTKKPIVTPLLTKRMLVVKSKPEGATVYVNDKIQAEKTPTKVELPPGQYEVRLVLKKHDDWKGNREIKAAEDPQEINPTLKPMADVETPVLRAPRKFALLVGVRDAGAGLPIFQHASADMVELGRVLVAAGYRKEDVTVLVDSPQARRDGNLADANRIRAALNKMLIDNVPGDTILVALAGPAIVAPATKAAYFCPAETDGAKAATLIELKDLFNRLVACRAATKLVLLETARAGAPLPAPLTPAVVEDVVPPGVIALVAAPKGEGGFVHTEERHGAFWYFVQRGLRGAADADGTGKVTVGELANFVADRTEKYVRKTYPGRDQKPRLVDSTAKGSSAELASPHEGLKSLEKGDALKDRKVYAAAVEAYDEALAKKQELIEAYVHRAEARYHLEQFDKMRADCDEALRLDPNCAPALDFRGDAHLEMAGPPPGSKEDQLKLAIADYETAIKLDPDFAPVYHSCGIARAYLKEDDRAIEDYKAAIKLAPTPNPDYFISRGKAYLRKNNLEDAVNDYSEAIRLNGKNADYYVRRGKVFLRKENWEGAVNDFTEAIRLDANDPEPLLQRAKAFDKLKQADRADSDRKRAAELKKPASGMK